MVASVAVVVAPLPVMATEASPSFEVTVSVTELTSSATHAVYSVMAGVNGVGERATVSSPSSWRASALSVASELSPSTMPFTCIFNTLVRIKSSHTRRLLIPVRLLTSAMDQPACASPVSLGEPVFRSHPLRPLTTTA